jgi:hypothetical protein
MTYFLSVFGIIFPRISTNIQPGIPPISLNTFLIGSPIALNGTVLSG